MTKFNYSKHLSYLVFGIFLLYAISAKSQNCSVLNGPTTYSLNYFSTNAVAVSNVNASESVPGLGSIFVKNYTFTIPFFETNFTSTAFQFSNGVGIPQCGVVNSSQNSIASFCPSTTEIYNSFNAGTLITSNQNLAQISLGAISQAVGTKLYRVVGKCSGNIYNTSYFRITVVKEPNPAFNLSVSAQCQQNAQGLTTGWFDFKANGTKPTIPDLYLRTAIPSGSTCTTADIAINLFSSTSTITNFAFFSCNTVGTYTVKMIYKRPKVGGGNYNTEVPAGYGWTNFTWTKGFNTCPPQFPYEPERKQTNLDEGNEISNIVISPNPSDGVFKLSGEFNTTQTITVEVFDLLSKMVYSKTMEPSQSDALEFDLTNQSPGSYILLVKQGDKGITKTIVKE